MRRREDDLITAACHYNRYVKIYTRTGDAGETGLLDGRRVSKAEPRVDAYGEVDELNACLGLVLSAGIDTDLADMVVQIQRQLFSLGARDSWQSSLFSLSLLYSLLSTL